jgi:putative hydrolase of the HAD superfamily
MVKSVISDLGKVLVHFDNSTFFRNVAQFTDFSEQEISEILTERLDIIRAFDLGKISPADFFLQTAKILKADIDYDGFFHIYNDIFSLNENTVEIMAKLDSSCRMILLSNTDEMRFGFVRKKFPEVLFFDEYVLSFEVGSLKPDPQIYRVALQRAQALPHECVFIDDREENIKAADDLGIHTIHYCYSSDLEAELSCYGLLASGPQSKS